MYTFEIETNTSNLSIDYLNHLSSKGCYFLYSLKSYPFKIFPCLRLKIDFAIFSSAKLNPKYLN